MNPLSKLKDIKPNVPIHDYTFYAFIIFCLSAIIILSILAYIYFKKRKKLNAKEQKLKKLKNLDYSQAKKTAYEFTELARDFVNEENKEAFQEIIKNLEEYKYKPKVHNLEKEIINKMQKFIEEIK